jgi:hypothetical protein
MSAMGRKVEVIASNTKYEIARKLQLERGMSSNEEAPSAFSPWSIH